MAAAVTWSCLRMNKFNYGLVPQTILQQSFLIFTAESVVQEGICTAQPHLTSVGSTDSVDGTSVLLNVVIKVESSKVFLSDAAQSSEASVGVPQGTSTTVRSPLMGMYFKCPSTSMGSIEALNPVKVPLILVVSSVDFFFPVIQCLF